MSDAYSPIPELNLLKEFEERVGVHSYADGFSMNGFEYNRKDCLGSSARDPDDAELVDRLIPFAEATASGSFWSLWRCDDRRDLATLPVIFCGDEGDIWVHARNLPQFFRLIPLERDATDEDEDLGEFCPARQEYLTWLARNFGLTLPDAEEEAAITRDAMAEYGWRFAAWLGTFPAWDGVAEELADSLEFDYGIPDPSPRPE
ncbi:hypothetical protein AB0D04_00865 [Streptomyces sp. NPDC048483]|uniref:hypothetical protein n=1 Tax=Streptomyces sp. NPDC048483 TaxID=3154927 RepID=UPI003430AE62